MARLRSNDITTELGTPVATGAARPSLAKKLAALRSKIGRVEKKGTNPHFHYDYVRETDLIDALTEHLNASGLLLYPTVTATERLDLVKQTLTRVTIDWTWVDIDSGERLTVAWVGEGADAGDKGLNKAYTANQKYFLMKFFNIATGDDPEADAETDRRAQRAERQQRSGGRPEPARATTAPLPPAAARPAPPVDGRPPAGANKRRFFAVLTKAVDLGLYESGVVAAGPDGTTARHKMYERLGLGQLAPGVPPTDEQYGQLADKISKTVADFEARWIDGAENVG